MVYLPTTSYIEMNEWTLPAPPARVCRPGPRAKAGRRFETHKAFLRGGIWRIFSPATRNRTGCTSACCAVARAGAAGRAGAPPKCWTLLHRTQANDAYWHGLFGGLYLPHLRRAVWTTDRPGSGAGPPRRARDGALRRPRPGWAQ